MNADPTDIPIARYRESFGCLRRELALYPGKVTIHGRVLGGNDFETHIPLDELSPEFGRLRFRSRRCYFGLILFVALSVFLWGFVGPFGLPLHSARVIVTALLAATCLVWTIAYFPKCRAYRFLNRAGIIVLDCIEAGPEKERCREFAEAIARAIQEHSARRIAE